MVGVLADFGPHRLAHFINNFGPSFIAFFYFVPNNSRIGFVDSFAIDAIFFFFDGPVEFGLLLA